MKHTPVSAILKAGQTGTTATVKGWVRTKRESKNVVFINLNDGSCIHNLQIVANPEEFDSELLSKITTGAGVSITGELVPSQGSGQSVELQATEILVYVSAAPYAPNVPALPALSGASAHDAADVPVGVTVAPVAAL